MIRMLRTILTGRYQAAAVSEKKKPRAHRHHLHTMATSSARPKPTMKARPRARPRRTQDTLKVMVLIKRLAEKGASSKRGPSVTVSA